MRGARRPWPLASPTSSTPKSGRPIRPEPSMTWSTRPASLPAATLRVSDAPVSYSFAAVSTRVRWPVGQRPSAATGPARATCGTPNELADRLRQWGEAGASTIYLCILDLFDLDHVRLLGREVRPQLV